tara:strand:- start:108873 stop:108974 length:102 start_codon:yes stop_codon:yes gene_type:complete
MSKEKKAFSIGILQAKILKSDFDLFFQWFNYSY